MTIYIYEVSLHIALDIYDKYRAYLSKHIPEVISCAGFLSADVIVATQPSGTHQDMRVLYYAKSLSDIETYFEQHAAAMREDALQHFPSGFTASRQVYRKEA